MAVVGLGAAMLLSVAGWSRAGAQSEVDVQIEAFAFQPAAVTVPVGTTVVWVNHDPVAHTVTDVNQLWDSGLFESAESFSKTFTEPGVYSYYCVPHAIMIGTIEVTQ
jgi:plastocyanin